MMSLCLLFKRLKSLETSPRYIGYILIHKQSVQKEIHDTKKAIAIKSNGRYFSSYL